MSTRRIVTLVMLVICYVLCAIAALLGIFSWQESSPIVVIGSLALMAALTIVAMRTASDSDYVQARQSNHTLDLASKTLPFMSQGLDLESAQAVCDLLLPDIAANSVAITDREKVLGFAGADRDKHQPGSPIQYDSTRETLEDGETRVVVNPKSEGRVPSDSSLHAGIIAALVVDKHIVGTLKFYYRSASKLNETQKAMCEGFAQLLSTQLSLSYMQQKTEVAAKMELRALQAQINPHFLFNTINTIAATVRTDPDKARVMLREFAVYYRRLLENSEDLIPLSKEIEQTERYLMFQKARFGEENIVMNVEVEPGLEALRVPSFILQPIVENAVAHGRREEGALHIKVRVYHASDSVIISVADDGVGIPRERLDTLVDGSSDTGMGIALKNVNARLKACFGSISGLYIDSTVGKGTTVYLSLFDALATQHLEEDDDDDDDEAELDKVAGALFPKQKPPSDKLSSAPIDLEIHDDDLVH